MSQSFTRGTDFGMNGWTHSETPSGTVNGSNTLFTCANAYNGGSLIVWLNGQRKFPTDDFTETSPGAGTFTFVTAPATGASVRVDYMQALSVTGNADTVDGVHATGLYPEGGFIGFNAYLSADQDNIPNTTWTTILYDTEDFDIGGNFDTATGKFTAPYDGKYYFHGQARWESGSLVAGDLAYIRLRGNGTNIAGYYEAVANASLKTQQVSVLIQLTAGDEIDVAVYHNRGAATPDIDNARGDTFFEGHLIAKT